MSDLNFRDVGEFLAILKMESNLEEGLRRLRDRIGFLHIGYALSFQGSQRFTTPFVRTTYPPEWLLRYFLMNYVEIDPVVAKGFTGIRPFFWSELRINIGPERNFIDDSVRHGIGENGYSVPVSDRAGRRALMSFTGTGDAAEWRQAVEPHVEYLQQCVQVMHGRAVAEMEGETGRPLLSPREIECLAWTARGKDAASIAAILGLSEFTVRDYLKVAKRKLGCATIPQAVYEAARLELIKV